MRVHALQGDTLDALCHRHLGTTAGVVEKTLSLPFNYGLSLQGTLLELGATIELPDPPAPLNGAIERPLIQLWD